MTTTPAARGPATPGDEAPGQRLPDAGETPAPAARWLLRVVVLAAGAATMATQMSAARLLPPHVGSTSAVWATVIGVTLLFLAAGYRLGGWIADRRADVRGLALVVLGAAAALAAVPGLAAALPHLAALGPLPGAALGAPLLLALPVTLTACVPPYVVRLSMSSVAGSGSVTGRTYALSTVGSIVGTLAAAIVLIQWVGTRATLWSVAALLVVVGLLALWRGGAARVPVRPVLPAAPSPGGAEQARRDGEHRRAERAAPLALLALLVLVAGAAIMATEMTFARLLAPFFGASHFVWANVIALTLGFLALGYWLGGRMGDRRPTLRALAVTAMLAGAAVALLPFAAGPVLRASAGGIEAAAAGTLVGSFLGAMLLLAVPMTLLGMLPPWAIRLAVHDVRGSGSVAGRLWALDTVGSLLGTFTSVLVLVPAIGTRRTLVVAGLVPVALGAALLLRGARAGDRAPGDARLAWAGAGATLAVAALLLAPTGVVKPAQDGEVVFEGESRYQFVQVIEQEDGRRVLQLNEGWAVHSIYDPDTVLTGGIWDHFLVVPSANDARNMLIVGNAAGTASTALERWYPELELGQVEIDPVVTQVGIDWFERPAEEDVVQADGRPFLASTDQQWNVVHVDAYRQPYIPFHLATCEFFELVDERLTDDGVVSINVGSPPEDDRINEAIAATMRSVFPLVVRYRAEEYNEVILGVKDPDVTVEELRQRLRTSRFAAGTEGELGEASADDPKRLPPAELEQLERLHERFADELFVVEPDPDAVLTDDHAPVEWITDRMIFGEATRGGG